MEQAAAITRDQSLECWKKMCFSRFFEMRVKKAFDEKIIQCPIYLSVGQESISAALSTAFKDPAIFGQHRAHATYLSYGGNAEALVDELLHKPTGCAGGMGGSASIHSPAISMFGHSGFMGDQIPIAVGYALGRPGKRVLAIMGDASAEEDYIGSSLGYAAHKKLSILFVSEDNNLSILTPVAVRRKWSVVDMARGYGLAAEDIDDDPWTIMQTVLHLIPQLPALINIHTVRHLWHSGTGIDGAPLYDRFELTKQKIYSLGLSDEGENIENEARRLVDSLWATRLAIL